VCRPARVTQPLPAFVFFGRAVCQLPSLSVALTPSSKTRGARWFLLGERHDAPLRALGRSCLLPVQRTCDARFDALDAVPDVAADPRVHGQLDGTGGAAALGQLDVGDRSGTAGAHALLPRPDRPDRSGDPAALPRTSAGCTLARTAHPPPSLRRVRPGVLRHMQPVQTTTSETLPLLRPLRG
jgi:hypothetical protein